jgi:hypothetical protein
MWGGRAQMVWGAPVTGRRGGDTGGRHRDGDDGGGEEAE